MASPGRLTPPPPTQTAIALSPSPSTKWDDKSKHTLESGEEGVGVAGGLGGDVVLDNDTAVKILYHLKVILRDACVVATMERRGARTRVRDSGVPPLTKIPQSAGQQGHGECTITAHGGGYPLCYSSVPCSVRSYQHEWW
jgi:hypothetical protein